MDGRSGVNIVSIGGGTGLSTLLSGLKRYVGAESGAGRGADSLWIDNLTAVVTVTDDGGSSGRLREEFQILPPGDIRNCLVALAEDELLLTKLLQYRFKSDGDLSGHSFGNIFLTALTAVTGDFLEAIKLTSEVLAIKGRIFPSTVDDVTLVAELADGRVIRGETEIVKSRSRITRLRLSKEHCQPLPETLAAIAYADLATVGPGSLFTSIIPSLLVDGIVSALCESRALKVYICNIMTQPGETDGFTLEGHLAAIREYCPSLEFDYVLGNSTPISSTLREKYLHEGAVQVEPILYTRGVDETCVVPADLLSENEVVRHDPHKLASLLLDICHSRTLAPAE
jgi:uncharacterized cofD-like protein